MQTYLRRSSILVFLILCAILFLTFNPLFNNHAQARSYKPWVGTTIGWVNVLMDTTAGAPVATRYAPDTKVTILAIVSGQAIQPGDPNWYRISTTFYSLPLYIYSRLIIPLKSFWGKNSGTFPKNGKVIVVHLSQGRLYAYQSGKQVFSTAVITGRSALPTPTGTFHVFAKFNHTTFYSPWPKDSSYWYAPTHINYALEFLGGGYYLHDSWWHTVYGPGTSGWHHDPVYGWQWGTHGCVAMPNSAAYWLYKWAPVGITVQIER
jgi:lipoprotein-anchoring transpeptidase ErfK/SrfK